MDETRRVLVGLVEESEVVACSEESVERHIAWNHAGGVAQRGPICGPVA